MKIDKVLNTMKLLIKNLLLFAVIYAFTPLFGFSQANYDNLEDINYKMVRNNAYSIFFLYQDNKEEKYKPLTTNQILSRINNLFNKLKLNEIEKESIRTEIQLIYENYGFVEGILKVIGNQLDFYGLSFEIPVNITKFKKEPCLYINDLVCKDVFAFEDSDIKERAIKIIKKHILKINKKVNYNSNPTNFNYLAIGISFGVEDFTVDGNNITMISPINQCIKYSKGTITQNDFLKKSYFLYGTGLYEDVFPLKLNKENILPIKFRNFEWKTIKDSIIEKEGNDYNRSFNNKLIYQRNLGKYICDVIYIFENNRLIEGQYIFKIQEDKAWKNIDDYDYIQKLLTEKYDIPKEDKTFVNSQKIKNFDSDNVDYYFLQGFIKYYTYWQIQDAIIRLYFGCENEKVVLRATYKLLNEDEKKNKKNNDLFDNL